MQTIHTKNWLYGFLLTLITACGGGGGEDDDGRESGGGSGLPVTTTTYTVNFSADQVVSGAAAPDSVSATANLQTQAGDDFTASGTISITGASASAVTIHAGSAGEAGLPVLALSGSGGSWSIPAGTELDPDERNLLEASAFYVLVETPQGRLRAQILAPGWELSMLPLTAENAVPASSSTGSGTAGFMLAPDFGDYRIRITTSGMDDAISASLRNAVAGARGDVRVALEAASGRPGVWGTADINNPNFGPRFSSGDFRLLEEGSLHLSVETASSPEGAIRGQLLPEGVGVFPLSLSSGEVVSDTSVTTSGEASATMTYSETSRVFALALDTSLADATGVFVHRATAGSNGPLLFSLTPDTGLPGNWVLQPTALNADLADALENDELYVSVLTPSYPAGELRGQLTREPAEPIGKITPTLDASSTQSQPVDAFGGSLNLATASGAQVAATIPRFAVAETYDFSMTDIVALDGVPAKGRMLAAVQMGPANVYFPEPVRIDFDVTGMRTPGSVLVGFRTDNDGGNFRLIPLRDSNGVLGFAGTARQGTQVWLGVNGFSNIGLLEFIGEETPALIRQLLRQRSEFEFSTDFTVKLFNVVFGTDLSEADEDALADESFQVIIRTRRAELTQWMEAFKNRDELSGDDFVEYFDFVLATSFINALDLDTRDPTRTITTEAEVNAAYRELLELTEVYGAGLHLQCFSDQEDAEDFLSAVAVNYGLRLVVNIDRNTTEADFHDVMAVANELTECFNPYTLRAFFESFDTDNDEFRGAATDLLQAIRNNNTGDYVGTPLSDMPTDLIFHEPELVSRSPLTVEFREASERLNGVFFDTVRIVFEDIKDGVTMGRIELAEETSFPLASSQDQIDAGELPVVTVTVSAIASGPIQIWPNGIRINYRFDTTETSNALIDNLTRQFTGAAVVGQEFTPRSFAAEIDLEN